MSNPSFSNIDLWLFELAEGNLTPEQVEQLELFLLQHPELDVERDMWQMARMEKEQHAYPETSSLQRKRRPGYGLVPQLCSCCFCCLDRTLCSISISKLQWQVHRNRMSYRPNFLK